MQTVCKIFGQLSIDYVVVFHTFLNSLYYIVINKYIYAKFLVRFCVCLHSSEVIFSKF